VFLFWLCCCCRRLCLRSADIVRPSDTFPVVPCILTASRVVRRWARRLTPVRRRSTAVVRGKPYEKPTPPDLLRFSVSIFSISNNIIPLACLSDSSSPPNHPSIIICRLRPLRSGQSRSLINTPKRRRFRRLFSLVLCLLDFYFFFLPSCSGHLRLTFTTPRDRIDFRWYVPSQTHVYTNLFSHTPPLVVGPLDYWASSPTLWHRSSLFYE